MIHFCEGKKGLRGMSGFSVFMYSDDFFLKVPASFGVDERLTDRD
jgi:hypothetical protein